MTPGFDWMRDRAYSWTFECSLRFISDFRSAPSGAMLSLTFSHFHFSNFYSPFAMELPWLTYLQN